MPTYLDFEQPIAELEEQLSKAEEIAEKSKVDASSTIDELKKKLTDTKKEIYNGLTPWQRVMVSRHPERPYTLDYINGSE